MEPTFDLTGHVAKREPINCPVLARAHAANAYLEKMPSVMTDAQRRAARFNSKADFGVAMTRVRLKISKMGLN